MLAETAYTTPEHQQLEQQSEKMKAVKDESRVIAMLLEKQQTSNFE